ncbi:MAG: hypothetical protein QOJ99_5510 [Bryobacterales bacterium]|jgi:hypothetical protein|nr:hypothetical protein [Bryobacterales bacterium]
MEAALPDANQYSHENLPVLVAGGGNGAPKTGRYLRYAKGTPTTNLWLTLLHHMDNHPASIGDSNRLLDGLTGL